MNKFTRFAGLSIAGSEHITTVNEVLLWQTGFPIRTSFEQGFPVHDINQFSTKRLIDKKEIELVIWINSFNEKKIIIIIAILLTTTACEKLYDKGKKGDFLFRKCAKCGLNEN